MKEMTISPGEDLYKKGDQVKSIYFIIKGVLEEYVEIGINEKALVLGQIKVRQFNLTKYNIKTKTYDKTNKLKNNEII